jgi:ABC-type multidrug transport system fused ATPase/permease subunit
VPIWLYNLPPLLTAIIIIGFLEVLAMIGLFAVRRWLQPHLKYTSSVSDPVSGTVQAIGVFYGITVGLIAIGVWNTNSSANELVSREATAIGTLYRDVSGYPEPLRQELRSKLREYTVFIIEQAWPAQITGDGQSILGGTRLIDDFQAKLFAYEPSTPGQVALHNEAMHAYNNLIEYRRLRIDAVNSGLSFVMWVVIWAGAIISIGVAYFFDVDDWKLHAILVGLMAGFVGLVIFMIIINDRPFFGYVSVSPDPYKLILERLIDVSK